jgi:hypothetical protein
MNTPFPQANDIYKVIWLIDSKINQKLSKSLDFINMNITPRQIEYYQNAGEYLGLLSEGKPTNLAIDIFSKSRQEIILNVALIIKKTIIFNKYYQNNDKDEVVKLIQKLYDYSPSTSERRFITVKVWTDWAKKILREIHE